MAELSAITVMRRRIAGLLFATLLAAPADAASAFDLDVTAKVSPGSRLAPGDVALLILAFRNYGPGDIQLAGARTSAYPILEHARFALRPAPPSPCAVSYDDLLAPPGSGLPSEVVAFINAGPIAAGEARECTMQVIVFAAASGTFELEFDASTPADPIASNNRVVVMLEFVRRVQSIPVAGIGCLASMALMLAFLGCRTTRDRG